MHYWDESKKLYRYSIGIGIYVKKAHKLRQFCQDLSVSSLWGTFSKTMEAKIILHPPNVEPTRLTPYYIFTFHQKNLKINPSWTSLFYLTVLILKILWCLYWVKILLFSWMTTQNEIYENNNTPFVQKVWWMGL